MKHRTRELPKTKLLGKILNLPPYAVVGILESLWLEAAQQSPPIGDIGRLSDEELALAIGWDREPKELVDALQAARWLDAHAEYRLLVHDWADHCPDHIHKQLALQRLAFADGQQPKTSRLNREQKNRLQEECAPDAFMCAQSADECAPDAFMCAQSADECAPSAHRVRTSAHKVRMSAQLPIPLPIPEENPLTPLQGERLDEPPSALPDPDAKADEQWAFGLFEEVYRDWPKGERRDRARKTWAELVMRQQAQPPPGRPGFRLWVERAYVALLRRAQDYQAMVRDGQRDIAHIPTLAKEIAEKPWLDGAPVIARREEPTRSLAWSDEDEEEMRRWENHTVTIIAQ